MHCSQCHNLQGRWIQGTYAINAAIPRESCVPPKLSQNFKCLLGILFHSFLLDDAQDGNDMDKVFLVVPNSKGSHLKVCSIGQLDLNLLGCPVFIQTRGGDIWDGGTGNQLPLLAF